MKIGILSNPSNFHCKKWANALSDSGADVFVFTMEEPIEFTENIQFKIIHLSPTLTKRKEGLILWEKNNLTYTSFYKSFFELKIQIKKNKIDLLHPLHLTPFGTWARLTGFHPTIGGAMGADVLEYPPGKKNNIFNSDSKPDAFDFLQNNSWDDSEIRFSNHLSHKKIIRYLKKKFFRYEVSQTTDFCDAITADNQTLVDALHHWFHVPLNKIHRIKWGLKEDIYGLNPIIHHIIESVLNELKIEFNLPMNKIPGDIYLLIPRGIKPIYQIDAILEGLEDYFKSFGNSHIKVILLSTGYGISDSLGKKINYLSQKFNGRFYLIDRCLNEIEMRAIWEISDAFISAPVYDGYSSSVAEGRVLGKIPLVNNISANNEVFKHLENAIFIDPFNVENIKKILHFLEDNFDSVKVNFKKLNAIQMSREGWIKNDAEKFLNLADLILKKHKQ